MPKRDIAQRMEKYKTKLTPERMKETLELRREQMIAAQKTKTQKLIEIEEHVRAVLGGEEVVATEYIWYQDFARQVFKVVDRYGGGYAAFQEIQLLIDRWKGRKLDPAVMAKIRDEVFGVQKPK